LKVVLASGSPRRQSLLGALIGEFDVVPADIAEPLGDDAVADAVALAAAKATHVAGARRGIIVVGADTIVFRGTVLYGKPSGPGEARAMLRELRGKSHGVVTGIAVAFDGRLVADAAVSIVTLRGLSDGEIDSYVASGRPLDKAGAYAIQEEEFAVVDALDGCYCNVVGLPLWRLSSLLARANVSCDDPAATDERCRACPDRPPGV
jgi:MAF protein